MRLTIRIRNYHLKFFQSLDSFQYTNSEIKARHGYILSSGIIQTMSTYTITTLCSVLWYMCVLLTWMRISQDMKLFADHSPHGWLMIFVAFIGSLVLNFILNPLIWVVAGCYIQSARKEDKTSKWQFYPGLIGVVLLVTFLASFFTNTKIPKLLGSIISREAVHPSERSAGCLPEVSGIMFSGNAPKALIDGYILKEGEEIEGFVLEEIKENSVTFLGPDGTRTVRRVK